MKRCKLSEYEKKFGFYPYSLKIEEQGITISTLPDLKDKVSSVNSDGYVEKDWIYSSHQLERNFPSGRVRELPYPGRIFGLSKTHVIRHATAKSEEHIDFLVWALSFFVGMRLTTTEAGFCDATPIKPHKLVDFILHGNSLNHVL